MLKWQISVLIKHMWYRAPWHAAKPGVFLAKLTCLGHLLGSAFRGKIVRRFFLVFLNNPLQRQKVINTKVYVVNKRC